jgi:hypothetical protein
MVMVKVKVCKADTLACFPTSYQMPVATAIMFHLIRRILPRKVFNKSIVGTAN